MIFIDERIEAEDQKTFRVFRYKNPYHLFSLTGIVLMILGVVSFTTEYSAVAAFLLLVFGMLIALSPVITIVIGTRGRLLLVNIMRLRGKEVRFKGSPLLQNNPLEVWFEE